MAQYKLGIIGLGYVGLPLAVEFAKKYPTIGFDINEARIGELSSGLDRTLEVDEENLKSVIKASGPKMGESGLLCTNQLDELKDCNFYIVTVPTPTDKNNRPILTPLIRASETVGKVLKKGDIVVYESTVYPGVTEDECIPVLEKISGLKYNVDFFAGYSPERINPGDKEHTVTKILKVTSGSTPEIAEIVDSVYRSIIVAGTYKASCIKVAEAAKVIENCQRDINIAFVNELSLIFERMNIDTLEVLEAAGTKWNFLPFRPGLVGGHCIGVDPYYLTFKAQELGYNPEVILSGRRINDGMGAHVAQRVIKLLIKKNHKVNNSRVLVLGITFKENCPDIRNTKVVDIIGELNDFGVQVDIYDPWADQAEVKHEYGLDIVSKPTGKYEAVIVAVGHNEFKQLNFQEIMNENSVLFDVKSLVPKNLIDGRL